MFIHVGQSGKLVSLFDVVGAAAEMRKVCSGAVRRLALSDLFRGLGSNERGGIPQISNVESAMSNKRSSRELFLPFA